MSETNRISRGKPRTMRFPLVTASYGSNQPLDSGSAFTKITTRAKPVAVLSIYFHRFPKVFS